jgi:hypothetical protein
MESLIMYNAKEVEMHTYSVFFRSWSRGEKSCIVHWLLVAKYPLSFQIAHCTLASTPPFLVWGPLEVLIEREGLFDKFGSISTILWAPGDI